jgi:hypothetical protein
MSINNGRDYLYLVWKEPDTRRQDIVGVLSRNGRYEFSYATEVNEALRHGFELLPPFNDIKETYKSDVLFPVFSSRLPDKKRKGINDILSKYGLDNYDEYVLLKRSGARLPIDYFEFIDPIFEYETDVTRNFYLAGPRHYLGCEGSDCAKAIDVSNNESLILVREPENEYDQNAIKVLNKNQNLIGYIPRYYAEGVTERLSQGANYACHVLDVIKDNNCNECIKVSLRVFDTKAQRVTS